MPYMVDDLIANKYPFNLNGPSIIKLAFSAIKICKVVARLYTHTHICVEEVFT